MSPWSLMPNASDVGGALEPRSVVVPFEWVQACRCQYGSPNSLIVGGGLKLPTIWPWLLMAFGPALTPGPVKRVATPLRDVKTVALVPSTTTPTTTPLSFRSETCEIAPGGRPRSRN